MISPIYLATQLYCELLRLYRTVITFFTSQRANFRNHLLPLISRQLSYTCISTLPAGGGAHAFNNEHSLE